MPNFILTQSSVIMCPHGGTVLFVSRSMPNHRINGEWPMLLGDTYNIVGCPFVQQMGAGYRPNPCMTLQWLTGSSLLFVKGIPALTNVSVGICKSIMGVPAGPPIISSFQMTEQEPRTFTRVD